MRNRADVSTCPTKGVLESCVSAIVVADTNGVGHIEDEQLSVTDLSGPRRCRCYQENAAGAAAVPNSLRPKRKGRTFALESLTGDTRDAPRTPSGMAELDRVTGGGFVRGSVLLLGGDPGIGKSTLLIQAASRMARQKHRSVYISGEEAVAQVRLRAERLGLGDANVELAAETAVEDIVATLADGKTPRLVVIDSIQTMWTDTVESAPGTVTQVRGSAQALIRHAKRSGSTVILVGHVTKDGQIAGPRVVEHMVDAVLSFEGDGGRDFRILRGVKNRFGATDEIGLRAIEKRAHVHDIHATILHLLGLNHFRTLYEHNGRMERPTVNDGEVIKELFS